VTISINFIRSFFTGSLALASITIRFSPLTRGFFNQEFARAEKKKLLTKIEKSGFNTVVLPDGATSSGAIETVKDAQKCVRLFNEHRYEIDGIIVSLPNFGDEISIAVTLSESKLDAPVLVHATDDDTDMVDLLHRRDAFCGKVSVCNNLHQYGIPFTDTEMTATSVQLLTAAIIQKVL